MEDTLDQEDEQQQQQQQQQHQQALGRLVDPPPGERVHFCAACNSPIAVYGRLMQCMHTFCLACAADMPQCFICEAPIKGIVRIPRPRPVFISAATLQSFASEAEMQAHTRRLHNHITNTIMQQQQQQ